MKTEDEIEKMYKRIEYVATTGEGVEEDKEELISGWYNALQWVLDK